MGEKRLTIDELAVFCKRRGFIFRSSEIYGGFAGFWDFGPLGAGLFNNIKQDFWKYFVQKREDMAWIDASVISHPMTWRASGHLASFSDIAVVCRKCKKAAKIDKSELGKVRCPDCGGEFTEQGTFNLMFETKVGALNPTEAYLRGETAQAMFMNFKQVAETARMQLPFGIGQLGRCFRNEIAPRDFLFRCREFHIGEFEFFIHPEEKECPLFDAEHKNMKARLLDAETQEKGKDTLKETAIGVMVKEKRLDEWHAYWLAEQLMWLERLGLSEGIKIKEHMSSELSHYSSATFDLDYEYPFGSREIAGNANRGQYDLTQHANASKEKIDIFDEKTKKRVVPRVIEPTFGIERIFLALLCKAYNLDKQRDNVVLKLPAFLAPVKAAVFPIVKNDEKTVNLAREVFERLREEWKVEYDDSGSVGRRYSRADESGIPMCITIDADSLKDKSVTIRDRDSTKQIRVKIESLKDVIEKVLRGESLLKLGRVVETRVKQAG